jgi:hypothetical protein
VLYFLLVVNYKLAVFGLEKSSVIDKAIIGRNVERTCPFPGPFPFALPSLLALNVIDHITTITTITPPPTITLPCSANDSMPRNHVANMLSINGYLYPQLTITLLLALTAAWLFAPQSGTSFLDRGPLDLDI